jgi:hypothetical protein
VCSGECCKEWGEAAPYPAIRSGIFGKGVAMIIYLSLLVALIGVLMYALYTNVKLAEIGRIAYFSGLLAFLLQVAPHLVGLTK